MERKRDGRRDGCTEGWMVLLICSSDPKSNVCECHSKSPGVSGGVRLGT